MSESRSLYTDEHQRPDRFSSWACDVFPDSYSGNEGKRQYSSSRDQDCPFVSSAGAGAGGPELIDRILSRFGNVVSGIKWASEPEA